MPTSESSAEFSAIASQPPIWSHAARLITKLTPTIPVVPTTFGSMMLRGCDVAK